MLATKGYGRSGPGRNTVGASRSHLIDAVDASLERLNTDYIDLYRSASELCLIPKTAVSSI